MRLRNGLTWSRIGNDKLLFFDDGNEPSDQVLRE
jgi:hypothetical protein